MEHDGRSGPPGRADSGQRDAAERAFFAGHYAGRHYNAVGWRLRMERDLRLLRRVARRQRRADREDRAELGRVLSVGCGDGAFELMLAPHASSVLALDLSPEAIELARRAQAERGVENIEFRCASFHDLPWDDDYDAIVCLAFLHHVATADLADFLRDCRNHLAAGGLFYSQDPNVNGVLRSVGRAVLGARYDTYHTSDERELDPEQLLAEMRAAGFDDVTARYVDLTLIPASYVLRRGPDFLLHLCAAVDRFWCATPLAARASGFAAWGRRGERT